MLKLKTTDPLGDRMKAYEARTELNLLPMIPTFARVDGRAFHNFTKGLCRPFDVKFNFIMRETALELAKETNACMAYTQSDEITLAWLSTDPKSEIWFNYRHSKMVSQLAALATIHFYQNCVEVLPEYAKKTPTFDARVWQVPNTTEGANIFLWRELDATRNSISMAAQAYYSHKELHEKNSSEKQKMLMKKGINWENYSKQFRRGSYIQRRKFSSPFTAEEIEKLPSKHEARKNPNLVIERSSYVEINMPIFSTITNKEDVIFNGAGPIEKKIVD